MYDEREATKPLKVPKRAAADFWLKGYKAGYMGEVAVPPNDPVLAEIYWRGYGEGRQAQPRLS